MKNKHIVDLLIYIAASNSLFWFVKCIIIFVELCEYDTIQELPALDSGIEALYTYMIGIAASHIPLIIARIINRE